VIVPLVNNRAEACAAHLGLSLSARRRPLVRAIRAALYGGAGYVAEANDEIVCIAMIETREGIDNLDSIVTTPGLGGVYVGPNDLALALGLPFAAIPTILAPLDGRAHPSRLQAARRPRRHPHRGRRIHAAQARKPGSIFVTLGTDAGFMMQAVTRNLAAVRGTRRRERESNRLFVSRPPPYRSSTSSRAVLWAPSVHKRSKVFKSRVPGQKRKAEAELAVGKSLRRGGN